MDRRWFVLGFWEGVGQGWRWHAEGKFGCDKKEGSSYLHMTIKHVIAPPFFFLLEKIHAKMSIWHDFIAEHYSLFLK
jgi:hypothetical protein